MWLDGLNTEINKHDLPRNKTVSRVSLCPKSKEVTSILSVESLWNSSFHRRFLTNHAKSPARVNLEILVSAKLGIERKVVRLKLFVETVPETTKTWWKTKFLWIRVQFLIPRRKRGWHRQRSVRGLVYVAPYPGCQRLFIRGFRFRSSLKKRLPCSCLLPKAEDVSACGRRSSSSHARKNLWYPG